MLKEIIAKTRSCTCNKSSTDDINALKESKEKIDSELFFCLTGMIQLIKYWEIPCSNMGIRTVSEYVQFYVGLNMQDSISLSSFVYNERLVMTNKLENSPLKEQIIQGLKILDDLLSEIRSVGERAVLEKYAR